jgi:hypothetical protein
MTRQHRCGSALAIWVLLASGLGVSLALFNANASAEPIQTGPREPNLMPGQVIDGWTGLPIPCLCRFQGETYRLGDVVCMSTHLGVVMTRCELFMNNTSWMPTREPCTLSEAKRRQLAGMPMPWSNAHWPELFCRAS